MLALLAVRRREAHVGIDLAAGQDVTGISLPMLQAQADAQVRRIEDVIRSKVYREQADQPDLSPNKIWYATSMQQIMSAEETERQYRKLGA